MTTRIPEPIGSGSIHRIHEDLWFGVIDGCNHTFGPDTWEQVDAEMGDHFNLCPGANRTLRRPE